MVILVKYIERYLITIKGWLGSYLLHIHVFAEQMKPYRGIAFTTLNLK